MVTTPHHSKVPGNSPGGSKEGEFGEEEFAGGRWRRSPLN